MTSVSKTSRTARNTQEPGSADPAAVYRQLNPFAQDWGPVGEYVIDAAQRTILFWDLLRQRSDQYYKEKAKALPNVLTFDSELVLDARTFKHPANYLLFRIKPPDGITIDPLKRPFVVVDPRAGHGPGIGGFKSDSELGVALRAGHNCYFVGFTPDPVPGQTIEDIMLAETIFLEKVIALHPKSDGKPCVIGNCQAGWAVMIAAAVRPDLFGPIIVPGSPLSYWAGIEGENPMRYTGGLAGGSWITAMTSDLGNGTFDGGHLVRNFENLNPANTLWSKNYDVWTNIDTNAERFLEFEKWWGGHVNLNAEEIQWIVDQLFIGNKLATGEIMTRDGRPVDLRNIRSPIICFCSKGDNITPPQQALGWIADLYVTSDDILASGQTIIYAIHESVGHLGIFVSGGIAKKEHNEFASNIDLIDVLPPGLYEAVMVPKADNTASPDRVVGDWIVRFEPRTMQDIHAIVQPDPENERRFAAVQRVSELNLGIYQTLLQPLVQASVNEQTSVLIKKISASDLPFELFSERNPLMQQVSRLAEQVRQHRQSVSTDNPLLEWQSRISEAIVASLDNYRQLRDMTLEQIFLTTYGSPLLQALVGLPPGDEALRKRPETNPERIAFVKQRIAELRSRIAEGGVREATIRSLVFIDMAGAGIDERAFNELRTIRTENQTMTLSEFKQVLREQFFSLLLDQNAALEAIPKMLSANQAQRAKALEAIQRAANASGKPDGLKAERLAIIEKIFNYKVPNLPKRKRRA